MSAKPTEAEIKKMAQQLRKPTGEAGIKIGELMNYGNAPMNLYSIAVLNPQAEDNILEIGMGNGFFVKNIVSLHPSIQYTGCDYSELMVEKSTKMNANFVEKGNARFVLGQIQDLPFEDNLFDKILTINTFYFWDNHEKVLTELKRVLKPDGVLTLSVRPKSNLEEFPVTKHGFALLSNEEIMQLLQKQGFTNIQITKVQEPPQKFNDQIIYNTSLILNCSFN